MNTPFAFLLAITTVLAQSANRGRVVLWSPPAIHAPSESPRSTVPKPMITRIVVEGFPISLEQTTLEAARSHFRAVAGHQGDASEALSWICFSGRDEVGLWALWLISSEIDGPDIGGLQWRRIPAGEEVDPRCQSLQGTGTVKLPLPIQLGMSETQVESVIGDPSMKYGHSAIYSHHHSLTIGGQLYSADNTIYLSYLEGVLRSVAVIYTVSS